jgi:hypothetical protein
MIFLRNAKRSVGRQPVRVLNFRRLPSVVSGKPQDADSSVFNRVGSTLADACFGLENGVHLRARGRPSTSTCLTIGDRSLNPPARTQSRDQARTPSADASPSGRSPCSRPALSGFSRDGSPGLRLRRDARPRSKASDREGAKGSLPRPFRPPGSSPPSARDGDRRAAGASEWGSG